MSFGFFITPGQPSFVGNEKAQCMFCKSMLSNTCWVPSKLRNNLRQQHKEHQNKPASLFENCYKKMFLNLVSLFKILLKVLLKMIISIAFTRCRKYVDEVQKLKVQ